MQLASNALSPAAGIFGFPYLSESPREIGSCRTDVSKVEQRRFRFPYPESRSLEFHEEQHARHPRSHPYQLSTTT